MGPEQFAERRRHQRRVWKWAGISVPIAITVLFIVGVIVIRHAGPLLKGRVEETLSTRFNSRVELESLNVHILSGLEISGSGLKIYPPDSVAAAGDKQPLIAIKNFSFRAGLIGLFIKPTHVRVVNVSGLDINIPPANMRLSSSGRQQHKGKIKIVAEEINCDNSRLIIGNSNPNKDPRNFELKHIQLRDFGPNRAWQYDAILTNAIPRGEIHASGSFGPWQTDSPGDSAVNGHYTFDHADLYPIKGIGGILSSIGDFKGKLNKIVVDGTTETPKFSLDTANQPVSLHTRFHAIVDGTSGDTYLQPVHAKLRDTEFTSSGAVINIHGKGHQIVLDVDVPAGHLQDFLDLAVKTRPAVMTAIIGTKLKLEIRPGKESITQKLSFQGNFSLHDIHLTNPAQQDKVDMLSLRAEGKPKEAKPGAPDVNSQMHGTFQLANGVITFTKLTYLLPSARINLEGVYSLDGQKFDFHGHVLTDASLSQMVASPVGSFLLKAISPFFHKKGGGGADIPVSISGTKSEPKFGLDVFGHH